MVNSFNRNSNKEVTATSCNKNQNCEINGKSEHRGDVNTGDKKNKKRPPSSSPDIQTGVIKTVKEETRKAENIPDYYKENDKYIDLILNKPDNTRVLINVSELSDIYTAGNGINITDRVISNTQTSAEWGNIAGNIDEQHDLTEALAAKADASALESYAALLNNYVPQAQLATETQKGIVQVDGETIVAEEGVIRANVGTTLPLGSPVYLDVLLSSEDSKGFALAGTYVYKEAVSGSRYGYPDFYQKWIEQYEDVDNTDTWLANNITVQGSVTQNRSEVRGFSSSNYITTPDLGITSSDSVEIYLKLNTGNSISANTFLGMGFGMQFYNSKMDLAGTTTIGSYTYSINTDYYFKITYSNQTITAYYSIDGINYVQDGSISYTGNINSYVQFGYGYYNNALAGGVYLDETFVTVNGKTVWKGTINGLRNPNGRIFYDISQKSVIDGIYASTGVADFWGVDKEKERIFTPRNDWFMQGCSSVSEVNGFNEAGLPNITGGFNFSGTDSWVYADGAFTSWMSQGAGQGHSSNKNATANIYLNASGSSSVYGNSETVQPKSSGKLLYYIVGNTELKNAVTDVIDITTTENDTIPLGYSTYSGDALSPTLGWLKSSGQWNSGEVYSTFYNTAVSKLGQAFANGMIVEHTDSYTDYDLVINQEDETFRLPLYDGSEDLLSDKLEHLVFDSSIKYTAPANGWYTISRVAGTANAYLVMNNVTKGIDAETGLVPNNWETQAYTVQASKGDIITVGGSMTGNINTFKFIYAQGNGSLYFKAANSVQNLELLNAGEVLEAVQRVEAQTHITETYKNGSSWYRVYSDGWCEQGGKVNAPSGSAQILTVSLLKTFRNNDYTVTSSTLSTSTTDGFAYWFGSTYSKTDTSIQFRLDHTGYLTSVDWMACGYLAEGEY